ncbi:MAG: hypothetical protein AUK55_04980 [Syntrophobacteraceae bacterium CG2_30_61_12]|nr:MAG: hypothetical protein AUK55_04980 [Syntrophobacteraceae bacterium CG2_30_61_12]
MSPEAGLRASWNAPPVAVLADQSLVWGLICRDALTELEVPARFLDATAIGGGALERFRVLVVPGGWAGHKLRALGDGGRAALLRFIAGGGSYLGFCGGAGLALNGPGSLDLVPVRRLPVERRLPNVSGAVWIAPAGEPESAPHPAWQDLPRVLPSHIWWPSQFEPPRAAGVSVVARYRAVGRDFCAADLPLRDLADFPGPIPWAEWEARYGIHLDPQRLMGEPAIIEATHGHGRLVLSYPHLETPGDAWGRRLFRNLLQYLDRQAAAHVPLGAGKPQSVLPEPPCPGSLYHLERARATVDDLIDFGRRHLLWDWRTPWLLNWRRGLRGLEYGSMAVTLGYLRDVWPHLVDSGRAAGGWLQPARQLEAEVKEFCRRAQWLLLEEKVSTQAAVLSKIGSVNPTVDQLRADLFGSHMHHGGRCRGVLDRIDRFLIAAWQLRDQAPGANRTR